MARRTAASTQHHERDPAGEIDDHRPYLTIPYWTKTAPLVPGGPGDDGQVRPLPTGVVSYLCPGIHASLYTPGSDLTVHVDVLNSGGGNITGLVTVTVWWEYPAPAFGAMTKNNLIGVQLLPVPPRRDPEDRPADDQDDPLRRRAAHLPDRPRVPSARPARECGGPGQ